MFYQIHSSIKEDFISVSKQSRQNFEYPVHLHADCEFICVEEGNLEVEIGECSFAVESGHGALILPNQPHAYKTPQYSKIWLVIFSSSYVPELKRMATAKEFFHPVIKVENPHLRIRLIESLQNPFEIKSVLYGLVARYYEGNSYPQLAADDGELLAKITTYLNVHYKEPISLADMARLFGYNYRYMSGIFNRLFKHSFSDMINNYRVSHACEMLSEGDAEITEIAHSCGFGSVRSFNRNFKEALGISPSEYRKSRIELHSDLGH